jgi:formylglycine-generating enzyme required for sulfatase activity
MNRRTWSILLWMTLFAAGFAIGLTAPKWAAWLLKFVSDNSDLIQGLADAVQILIWAGTAVIGIIGGKKLLARLADQPPAKKAKNRSVQDVQQSLVFTGDKNVLILDENFFRRVMGETSPPENLRQATERYLQYLLERYRYLDFKGMGIADRVPLRLELQNLYVPLKARIELPRGETWTRELLLAGRKMPDSERENIGERLSKPQHLSDLLQQNDGLIILGDPGAGKTTFLKYLALQMATGAETRLPVLVPLSAYANVLAERDVRLDDFMADYFHDLGLDIPLKPMLHQALKKGGAVVMLDGLDEVKEISRRDTVVRRVVDFYTFHRPAGNKFLLTSRIIGYREVRPTAAGLAECTLVDFDDKEIAAFVDRWTAAIEKAARGETQVATQEANRERQELLLAIQHNPGVRRLAANPLLLTILALMKRQGVRLPERRVELYQKYVETLLSSWNRARGLGRPPARDLDVVETVRILAPLALWMHEVNPGVGLVKQRELMQQLEAIYRERGEGNPERAARQFLSDVREHTGLLLERGSGQFGFIHLTFEEYLAAMAIAQRGQQSIDSIGEALATHVGDDNWREVSLLTIGYLGIIQQRDEAAGAVLQRLIQQAPGELGQAVVLAGEAVVDAWPGGVTPACKTEVAQALQNTMKNGAQVKALLRARAGDALARLGDPRFRTDVWFLPDEPLLGFVEIPAGEFLMGSDKEKDHDARDTELKQHKLTLPLYYIARYPVTVAQFKSFVDKSGYKPEHPGCLNGLSNHPVVNVTWYEALKYCEWLTEQLRAWEETPEPLASLLKQQGWGITLPSEAEWEKAARGTDGRIYPWGNEADANRANYDETGVNATSTVGCFPGGASPYGCEEMSGNVWEWTRSLWGKDSSKPEFKYPYDSADGREKLDAPRNVYRVLRGGAFDGSGRLVRCADRRRDDPGSWNWYLGFRLAVRPLSF